MLEFLNWHTIVWLIVGGVACFYFVIPLLIYFTLRQSADPKLIRIDLDDERLQVAMVTDSARAYHLHQALVERHGTSSSKFLRLDEEFDGDAREYLAQAALLEELNAQVGTGYLYLSEEEEVFRATLKGA